MEKTLRPQDDSIDDGKPGFISVGPRRHEQIVPVASSPITLCNDSIIGAGHKSACGAYAFLRSIAQALVGGLQYEAGDKSIWRYEAPCLAVLGTTLAVIMMETVSVLDKESDPKCTTRIINSWDVTPDVSRRGRPSRKYLSLASMGFFELREDSTAHRQLHPGQSKIYLLLWVGTLARPSTSPDPRRGSECGDIF
jgi:hypothetical protein